MRVIKFSTGTNLSGPNFAMKGREKLVTTTQGMTIIINRKIWADSSANFGNSNDNINGPAKNATNGAATPINTAAPRTVYLCLLPTSSKRVKLPSILSNSELNMFNGPVQRKITLVAPQSIVTYCLG